MPIDFIALDRGLPQLDGKTTEQQLREMSNYLMQLVEQLRYTLSHLGEENVNSADWENINNKVVFTALGKAGATEIDGGNIKTGTLDASKVRVVNISASDITTGTLDASKVAVENIDADNITSGTIDASRVTVENISASDITTGTLNAAQVTVENIDAGKITVGELDSVDIRGVNIYDSDIHGSAFHTAANAAEDVWAAMGSATKPGNVSVWGLEVKNGTTPAIPVFGVYDGGLNLVLLDAKGFSFLTVDGTLGSVTASGNWTFGSDIQLPAGSQYPTRTEVQAMIDAAIPTPEPEPGEGE